MFNKISRKFSITCVYQKPERKAVSQEEEEPECTDQNPPKVFSTEFRTFVDNVPSTSTDENVTQNFSEFENLKSTLRKEITEELKALFAQSWKATIRAIRQANRNDTEMINLDPEITPVRIRSSLNKTIRSNNVENLEPGCPRNNLNYPNFCLHSILPCVGKEGSKRRLPTQIASLRCYLLAIAVVISSTCRKNSIIFE